MPFNVDLPKEACEAFRSAIIMTSDQLMQLMDCSLRTVQRRVKQWLCHTSFNHNGRYYALPDVAQFDQYGIWAHQGVCFSRFGNLKRTVVGVVCEAEQGLSAAELAHRLHVNVHSFLSQFAAQQAIKREKLARTFRYFCADLDRARQQRECYLTAAPSSGPLVLSDAVAVKLLLAWIDAPYAEVAALSCRLQQQHMDVTPQAVAAFLEKHDLGGKKKLK